MLSEYAATAQTEACLQNPSLGVDLGNARAARCGAMRALNPVPELVAWVRQSMSYNWLAAM